jgi:hypothetical protein
VAAKTVAFGQCGVVKIVAGVVSHLETAHHRARAFVALRGERHDVCEGDAVGGEAERERGASRFGRVSVSPGVASKSPTDFGRRRERRLERDGRHPGEAEEAAGRLLLKCPQAPALSLEGGYYAIKEGVAFRVGQWRGSSASPRGRR